MALLVIAAESGLPMDGPWDSVGDEVGPVEVKQTYTRSACLMMPSRCAATGQRTAGLCRTDLNTQPALPRWQVMC